MDEPDHPSARQFWASFLGLTSIYGPEESKALN